MRTKTAHLYLQPNQFINSHNPTLGAVAQNTIKCLLDDANKAVALHYLVCNNINLGGQGILATAKSAR